MRRNRKLFQFQYWCQWCLSIWTFWWCHSWWRVDAHGWCTEGEWARYEVRMQKEGCVGKISRRTGIFSVKYRAIFGTDFNQYSAHILVTKCERDMKRHCMEKKLKNICSPQQFWQSSSSSPPDRHVGQRLERFGTFCPFHGFTAFYRCSPQLLN